MHFSGFASRVVVLILSVFLYVVVSCLKNF